MLSLLFLVVVLVFLGLDEVPLLLGLDGDFQGSVVVPLSVVAYAGLPPEAVQAQRAADDIRVVQLVVVAHPSSDHPPGSLPSGIGTYSRNLLGSAAC